MSSSTARPPHCPSQRSSRLYGQVWLCEKMALRASQQGLGQLSSCTTEPDALTMMRTLGFATALWNE